MKLTATEIKNNDQLSGLKSILARLVKTSITWDYEEDNVTMYMPDNDDNLQEKINQKLDELKIYEDTRSHILLLNNIAGHVLNGELFATEANEQLDRLKKEIKDEELKQVEINNIEA